MHGQRNSGGGDALIWDVCDAARVHEVCKARGEYLAAICGEEVISDEIGRRVSTYTWKSGDSGTYIQTRRRRQMGGGQLTGTGGQQGLYNPGDNVDDARDS